MISYSKWDKVIRELYDEVVKQMEENNKKMRLEYKFYEKNQCPKWLEGDYDLHIEGNKMTMTSKDGIKVSTRCHPEDDWRLQIGLDELKNRMDEKKKPREIKVGDDVRPIRAKKYEMNHCTDFFVSIGATIEDVTKLGVAYPVVDYVYTVKYIGKINNMGIVQDAAYIYNKRTNVAFVTPLSNLMRVEN